ncbi:hypothetical protein GCM10009623_31940 [Nocardioides aestuarii]|uniref:Integral membrane protein n=1 Tax=Nocardioides aestuarii TaxID=252231 RepID=A0ABW4TR00_9ACTN
MSDRIPNPPPLVVAASLAAVEGVLLFLYGVLELVSISGGRVTMGVTTAAFFLVYGAFLAFCARQLLRRASWARGFVMMAQIVQLGVAWSFRGESTTWLTVVLTVAAVVTGAGLLHPASVDALADDPTR